MNTPMQGSLAYRRHGARPGAVIAYWLAAAVACGAVPTRSRPGLLATSIRWSDLHAVDAREERPTDQWALLQRNKEMDRGRTVAVASAASLPKEQGSSTAQEEVETPEGQMRGLVEATGQSLVTGNAEQLASSHSSPLGEAVRSFLEEGPLETVARSTEAFASEAKLAGKALSKMASVSADEVSHGHLLGAFVAAGSTLSEEVDPEEYEGPTQSLGILLVFVLPTVCWLSELIAAKVFDTLPIDEAVRDVPETRLVLHALSFARYLMAWHVVLDHFAYGGNTKQQTSLIGEPWAVFARWGALAAPWFFMVSGFTNSYSKLVGPQEKRAKEEDFISAMVKRVLSWYPFYLIALIWCAIRVATSDAEDWAQFVAHTVTVHGLVWEQDSFPFLTGDVWLSFLVVYLLSWAPMHAALGDGSDQSKDRVIWTVFTTSFFITIPSAILEWLWFGDCSFFHMLQLWPSFVFGQALAFWFVKNCMEEKDSQVGTSNVLTEPVWVRRKVNEIPVLVRFGTTISILIFGFMFFTFSPYDVMPLFKKPVLPLLQKGFQLPLQGLMVVGLAAEIDPISKFFARRPFRFAEKLTLMTFLFQVPVYNTIKDLTGLAGMSWTFIGCLVAFTVVAHFLLERPYRHLRGDRERGENWKEKQNLKEALMK